MREIISYRGIKDAVYYLLIEYASLIFLYALLMLLYEFDWGCGIQRAAVLLAIVLLTVIAYASETVEVKLDNKRTLDKFLVLTLIIVMIFQSLFFLEHFKSYPIDIGRTTELAARKFFFEGLNPYTAEVDPGHGDGSGFNYFNGYKYGPLTFIAYAPFTVFFKRRGIYISNFILNLGSLVLIYLITRRVNPIDSHRIGIRAAIMYASCYLIQFELFEMGVIDILPVFFLLFSLYMFLKNNDLWVGIFLGLSLCARLIPAAFLFLLFISSKWKPKFLVGFALPFFTLLLPFLVMSFKEFTANLIIFNLNRPGDNTSILYFIPHNLVTLWILLSLITLIGLYANWYRSKKNELDIFFYLFWVISLFLLFNRILHRNYLIWVIPFICILLSNSLTLSQSPTCRQLKSVRECLKFKRNQ